MPHNSLPDELRAIAENWANLVCAIPLPNCSKCGGTGQYVVSRADHHPSCDGNCRSCPVEVPDYVQCDCFSSPVEVISSALIAAIPVIARKTAYKIATEKQPNGYPLWFNRVVHECRNCDSEDLCRVHYRMADRNFADCEHFIEVFLRRWELEGQ